MASCNSPRWPRRWDFWVSALFLNFSSGCMYDYGTYSAAVKETFGLNQLETAMVSTAAQLYLAIMAYPHARLLERLGTRICPLIGCAVMSVSYVMLLIQLLSPMIAGKPGAALLTCLLGLGFTGTALSVGPSYQRAMQIFPQSAGLATGVLKCSIGAGGSVLPALFFGLRSSRPEDSEQAVKFFPGFAGIFMAVSILAFAATQGASSGYEKHDSRRIMTSAFILVLATIFATASSLPMVPKAGAGQLLAAGSLLMTMLLLAGNCCKLDANLEDVSLRQTSGRLEMHVTLNQALRTAEYWMYLVVNFINCGSGQLVVSNISQIAASLQVAESESLVCMFAFSNMLGRLGFGIAVDALAGRRTSRTVLFAVTNILGAAGQVLFYVAAVTMKPVLLYPATLFVGTGFGGGFTTFVNICSARWGTETLRGTWTFLDAISNCGSALVFGSLLASYQYDRHADHSNHCIGKDCFSMAHLITAACNLVGVLLSLLLIARHSQARQIRHELSDISLSRTSRTSSPLVRSNS
mmetsp:Transcript_31418/g.56964  ORF Transcript_31418/g.56964 Transcript_31418/m.56964 type:complete len:523 (-) Transcript_31418:77-1645(-)